MLYLFARFLHIRRPLIKLLPSHRHRAICSVPVNAKNPMVRRLHDLDQPLFVLNAASIIPLHSLSIDPLRPLSCFYAASPETRRSLYRSSAQPSTVYIQTLHLPFFCRDFPQTYAASDILLCICFKKTQRSLYYFSTQSFSLDQAQSPSILDPCTVHLYISLPCLHLARKFPSRTYAATVSILCTTI